MTDHAPTLSPAAQAVIDVIYNCWDIAHTIYSPDMASDDVQVSSRGISYM